MVYCSLTNELFLDYQRMIDPFGAVIFWFILDFMLEGLSENLSVAARLVSSVKIERNTYTEMRHTDTKPKTTSSDQRPSEHPSSLIQPLLWNAWVFSFPSKHPAKRRL